MITCLSVYDIIIVPMHILQLNNLTNFGIEYGFMKQNVSRYIGNKLNMKSMLAIGIILVLHSDL